MASGEQLSFISAMTRNVSSTEDVSADMPPGSDRRYGVGDGLLQGRSVNPGMLPNIERMQMKAKRAHLQDKWVNQRACDAQACIGSERGAQRFEIVEEFVDRGVGRKHLGELFLSLGQGERSNRKSSGRMLAGLIEGALNTCLQANNEASVIFEFILRTKNLGLGSVHECNIGAEALHQVVADGTLLSAGGEQVDDAVELGLVVEEQVAAGEADSVPRDVGRDKGISVAVATDPRAEPKNQGQLRVVRSSGRRWR